MKYDWKNSKLREMLCKAAVTVASALMWFMFFLQYGSLGDASLRYPDLKSGRTVVYFMKGAKLYLTRSDVAIFDRINRLLIGLAIFIILNIAIWPDPFRSKYQVLEAWYKRKSRTKHEKRKELFFLVIGIIVIAPVCLELGYLVTNFRNIWYK